jgi:hypothetical protein
MTSGNNWKYYWIFFGCLVAAGITFGVILAAKEARAAPGAATVAIHFWLDLNRNHVLDPADAGATNTFYAVEHCDDETCYPATSGTAHATSADVVLELQPGINTIMTGYDSVTLIVTDDGVLGAQSFDLCAGYGQWVYLPLLMALETSGEMR